MAMESRQRNMRHVWLTFIGVLALLVVGFSPRAFTQGRGAQPPAPADGRAAGPAPAPQRGGTLMSTSNEGADFSPRPPIEAQTAEEEAKSFVLPPGYHMQPVLSDPQIVNPAIMEFDGNGRMYVAEFISYMPDADGNHEHDPINRITRWESTKGDGVYDKRTVFIDHMVLPRMILPLQDGVILTNETDSDDVVQWTDTNGDGVADKREVVFSGVGLGRDGNLEHEQSGFVWGLDNWIYSTYNAFRFRWTPNGYRREPTGPNGGQWGLTQDDDGKMWFVDAGGERGPVNFQFPIQYGAYTPCQRGRGEAPDPDCPPADQPGFETVYPIAGLGDMQGGMRRVRMPLGVLNHFTATNGPAIVRADKEPADMQGDLLFCEPVGRLIRRAKIVNNGGLTQLQNAYPESEFILSKDPLFRPVNIRTAPDGTMYIADMYHGIIQESEWTHPLSYLRRKIEQYQMDKITTHGRIWRLRFDGIPGVPATPQGPAAQATPEIPSQPALEPNFAPPHMYSETPTQLVAHLTSPNGWYRDMAQRLLVLKQDKSVVPALQQMARSSKDLVARFHAMWTLEGLGALDSGLVREEMKDPNPRMRVQAIRASETLYKAGDRSFDTDYRGMALDTDPNVAIQAMLTLNALKAPKVDEVVKAAQAANDAIGVKEIGNWILNPPVINAFLGRGGAVLTPEQRDLLQQGNQVFNELCFTCHGNDGLGAPMAGAPAGTTMAPPLAGSPRVHGHRDYVIRVLLNGLTGQVGDKTYTEVMVPMGQQTNEWIAGVASFIRTSFGNSGGFVTPADVARVRAATGNRKTQWTVGEIQALLPTFLPAESAWKVTASQNNDTAHNALTLAGWNTGEPQKAGMWLQVELPQAVNLTEVDFNVPAGRGGGGGGRGRGAAGRGGRAAGPGGPGAARGGQRQGAGVAPGGGRPGAGPAGAVGAPAQNVMPNGEYPRGYQVQVSTDGSKWSKPVATGEGNPGLMTISFKPVQAKFVRITQTATAEDAPNWGIENLRLYTAAGKN